jgi:exonuclease III
MVKRQVESNITMLHHNIQSLNNKILELTVYLHNNEKLVDVLCFTEHWMVDDQIKLINLDQYRLRSYFCRNIRRGGGVCIFVRDMLRVKQVHYLCGIAQEKSFELAAVELPDTKLVFVCIYRSQKVI